MATVVGLVAVVLVIGVLRQSTTSANERHLQQRGVAVTAHVVRSSYDPGGGDPDGWTTDVVQFRDTAGIARQAVVGHHGDDRTDRAAGEIRIVYDPQRPDVAMTRQEFVDATPGVDLAVVTGFALVLALAALGLCLPALEVSRAASPSR